MTGISDYLTSSFSVKHSMQFRRDWSIHFDVLYMLLCRSINAWFVDFVLLFLFHHETTTKAKFTFYAKENGS